MGKIQKVYSKEFKQEAVRLAQTSGKAITQVARELGISDIRFITGAKSWLRTVSKRFQAKGIRPNSKKKIAASSANTRSCDRSVRY